MDGNVKEQCDECKTTLSYRWELFGGVSALRVDAKEQKNDTTFPQFLRNISPLKV